MRLKILVLIFILTGLTSCSSNSQAPAPSPSPGKPTDTSGKSDKSAQVGEKSQSGADASNFPLRGSCIVEEKLSNGKYVIQGCNEIFRDPEDDTKTYFEERCKGGTTFKNTFAKKKSYMLEVSAYLIRVLHGTKRREITSAVAL